MDNLIQDAKNKFSNLINTLPFLSFGKHYVPLLIDSHGRVVVTLDNNDNSFLHSIVNTRMSGKMVSDFFQTENCSDLGQLLLTGKGKKTFNGVNYVNLYEKTSGALFVNEHHSSIFPLSQLHLFGFAGDYLLAVISLVQNPAHTLFTAANPQVYTLSDGTIAGYNSYFAAITETKERELLNRNISHILGGLGINTSYSIPEQIDWSFLLTELFDKKLICQASPNTLSLEESKQGLIWRSTKKGDASLIELPFELNFQEFDYRFVIKINNAISHPPGVVIAADKGNFNFPDRVGYHFTFDPINPIALVKKIGVIRQSSVIDNIRPESIREIVVQRTGQLISYEINGKTIISFFDTDALPLQKSNSLMLSLMPNAYCSLKSISIYSSRRKPLAPDVPAIPVRLVNNPSRAYHVQRSCCHFGNQILFAYQLIDMSQYYELLSAHNKLKKEIMSLEKENTGDGANYGFIGLNKDIVKIRSTMESIADTPLAVLIEGDTGTGKEMAAMAIHKLSGRKNGPFIKLDCTTIPDSLIESEIFGHEKGAFTGAIYRHAGRIEQANGGTLFIDEISNISPSMQAKLLDFLQTYEITRIGGGQRKKIDVRVITASNRPLRELVKRGLFREDLYYRINQITISIPPLYERVDDIPLLVNQFIKEANRESGKTVESVSQDGMKFLYSQKWEGNIRELRNVIYRAVFMSSGNNLTLMDLKMLSSDTANMVRSGKKKRFSSEEIHIEVERHRGNIRKTAAELGIGRATIYRKLRSK